MMELTYLKSSYLSLDLKWQTFLATTCADELIDIDRKLEALSVNRTIYPPQSQIFNALFLTPIDKVKIVILGQDPYHGKGEANGLAFAVNRGVRTPPSLRNIYKELGLNPGKISQDELLINWAKQGILLLNSSLTVIQDKPNSMADIGWQVVTDRVIKYINDSCEHVVFMLWGSFAQKKTLLIDTKKHLILSTTHPSPFSAHKGFLGCNHFNLANQYLAQYGYSPINWVLQGI